MTEYFQFRVWLKDEAGKVKKEPLLFKNVMHYSMVDGKFWYMRFAGKMRDKYEDKAFGSYDVEFVWLPYDRIFNMECTSQSIFDSHYDKERYIKEVLGLSGKKK